MADIPVKKSGSSSWIWWVIGLLFLAAVIWLLVESFDEDEPALTGVEPAVPEATAPGEPFVTEPITSLEMILDAENPQELVGRPVNLTGVTASAVTGDSTFWIYNPDEGIERRVFAVLHQLAESEQGPGTGADGEYNLDVGESMGIEGQIMAVGPNDPDAWGVTGTEAQELREYQVYIRVRDLQNLDTGGMAEAVESVSN